MRIANLEQPRRNSEASKEVKEGLGAQHMILESFDPLQCNALWRRRFLFSDFVQPCNTPANVIDMCEVGLRRNDVGLVGLITEVLQQCHCWLMFGVSTVQPSAGQHCHPPPQPITLYVGWSNVNCKYGMLSSLSFSPHNQTNFVL